MVLRKATSTTIPISHLLVIQVANDQKQNTMMTCDGTGNDIRQYRNRNDISQLITTMNLSIQAAIYKLKLLTIDIMHADIRASDL